MIAVETYPFDFSIEQAIEIRTNLTVFHYFSPMKTVVIIKCSISSLYVFNYEIFFKNNCIDEIIFHSRNFWARIVSMDHYVQTSPKRQNIKFKYFLLPEQHIHYQNSTYMVLLSNYGTRRGHIFIIS